MWTFSQIDYDLIRDDIGSVPMILPVLVYRTKEKAIEELTDSINDYLKELFCMETDIPSADIVWNTTDDPTWLEGTERNTEQTLILYQVTLSE